MADTAITIRFLGGLADLSAELFTAGGTDADEAIELTESDRQGLYTGTVSESLVGVFEVCLLYTSDAADE